MWKVALGRTGATLESRAVGQTVGLRCHDGASRPFQPAIHIQTPDSIGPSAGGRHRAKDGQGRPRMAKANALSLTRACSASGGPVSWADKQRVFPVPTDALSSFPEREAPSSLSVLCIVGRPLTRSSRRPGQHWASEVDTIVLCMQFLGRESGGHSCRRRISANERLISSGASPSGESSIPYREIVPFTHFIFPSEPFSGATPSDHGPVAQSAPVARPSSRRPPGFISAMPPLGQASHTPATRSNSEMGQRLDFVETVF